MVDTFPALPLHQWQDTRDTIHGYAQLLGNIRRAGTPPQKHWWHISLRPTATGLTTTPIRSGNETVELLLDFTQHQLRLETSHGSSGSMALRGQSLRSLRRELLDGMDNLGVALPQIESEAFADDSPGTYDPAAVRAFWQALSQMDIELTAFRHGLRQETSPVQLWPHHFDLAVNWFSGRLVPGQDPQNAEYADEQMNFGFSTGDQGTPEPYFYATAYPEPAGWSGEPLPPGAYWQQEGWSGAVLPYAAVVAAEDGRALLQAFLHRTQEAGAALMR